jgi:hypothetical protein
VQAGFRAAHQPGYEWRHILRVRNFQERLTIHRIDDIPVHIADGNPLATDQVLQYTRFAACHAVERVYSGKCRNFVAHHGFLC